MTTDLDRLKRSVTIATNMTVNLVADRELDVLVPEFAEGLSHRDFRETLDAYPYRLVRPPNEIYDDLPLLQEPGVDPPVFHVAVRCWTSEEGPSRLVLKLKLRSVPARGPTSIDTEILGLDLED